MEGPVPRPPFIFWTVPVPMTGFVGLQYPTLSIGLRQKCPTFMRDLIQARILFSIRAARFSAREVLGPPLNRF